MSEFKDYAIIDVELTKIEWELTGENIAERADEDNWDDIEGLVCVEALTESGDFEYVVLADDTLEGNLFQAMDVVAQFEDSGDFDVFNLFYATKYKVLNIERDSDKAEWEYHIDDREAVGYALSSEMGTNENFYDYSIGTPALCRVKWPNGFIGVWQTDDNGNFEEHIEESLFEQALAACK